jgi:hypothetical protein
MVESVMRVKLIKKKQSEPAEDQRQPSPPVDLFETTQSWVEEFKARQANREESLRTLLDHFAA